jgi:hypothetical protein
MKIITKTIGNGSQNVDTRHGTETTCSTVHSVILSAMRQLKIKEDNSLVNLSQGAKPASSDKLGSV